MAKIELKNWPDTLQNSGETILETLIANDVPFPFSCASGDCGACKGRVLCGEVALQPCPEGILSQEEREQGYVLACRCTPKSDVKLEALDELVALPAATRQTAWVVQQTRHQGDVVVLSIQPRHAVSFLPGQYFNLKFDNLPARAYSVASQPGESCLSFHIRLLADGKTSGYVRRDIIGHALTLDGPYGHGYWRAQHEGPLLAIAGGTGLAPMLSIVNAALRANARREVWLYYADREEHDVYWEAELLALQQRYPNLNIRCELSRATPPAQGALPRRYQRVTAALQQDWPSLAGAKVYVAGSPRMVDAVAACSRSLGLAPRDLHTDPFSEAHEHRLDGALSTWCRRMLRRWQKAPVAPLETAAALE